MQNVLWKQFPAETEMIQAGLFLTSTIVCLLVQGLYAAYVLCCW